MGRQDLTADRLRELLHYDHETGVFTWRLARRGTRVGAIAGAINKNGYVRIQLHGIFYYAHRLAWLYITGEWPTDIIDHKNTIRHANWFSNLRLATSAQNKQNQRKAHKHSKTGVLGVIKKGSRYCANIKIDGVQKHLGYFDTPEEASAAYIAWKVKLHPFQTIA